jgi:hypothetical protein
LHMRDVWSREQCRGAPDLRGTGTTAPTVYVPSEQRLDYLFQSATSKLAVQHLFIDYDLAAVPPGIDRVSYLSDHRPLGADLNSPQPHCTAADALRANVDAAGNYRDHDYRNPGGTKWYRFDEKGTYEFRVDPQSKVRLRIGNSNTLSSQSAGQPAVSQAAMLGADRCSALGIWALPGRAAAPQVAHSHRIPAAGRARACGASPQRVALACWPPSSSAAAGHTACAGGARAAGR